MPTKQRTAVAVDDEPGFDLPFLPPPGSLRGPPSFTSRAAVLLWSADSRDPNRSDFCGLNSWRRRTVLFANMDDAPLTAQGGQSYSFERRLMILDHDGGLTAAVAGRANNDFCRSSIHRETADR
ncbi:hypothetical protein U1Q18_003777 [Sarracenia purpurea var. burkii]